MRIVLDAGHSGQDSGAVGNGLKEKDLTLAIIKQIGRRKTLPSPLLNKSAAC
ncbi:N-acetylmuramoyl-L-alanine amidase [Parageobacillus thermoglucosidasius]|uniref:N-acetylmuramoyl-L-alanine amidase n=1 Tax=Parageobacillus thermoglucosidasius TaxID=1426 RepID=UPI000442FC30|nr:hypothetical protein GT2_23_00640 [Parageobacillus thermoglucosidasius NBRC 107763]